MGHPSLAVEGGGNTAMLARTAQVEVQWGHRASSVESGWEQRSRAASYCSFNAAADLRRWRAGSSPARYRRHQASMGPPIFVGGERVQCGADRVPPLLASMGPPIFVGGEVVDYTSLD